MHRSLMAELERGECSELPPVESRSITPQGQRPNPVPRSLKVARVKPPEATTWDGTQATDVSPWYGVYSFWESCYWFFYLSWSLAIYEPPWSQKFSLLVSPFLAFLMPSRILGCGAQRADPIPKERLPHRAGPEQRACRRQGLDAGDTHSQCRYLLCR